MMDPKWRKATGSLSPDNTKIAHLRCYVGIKIMVPRIEIFGSGTVGARLASHVGPAPRPTGSDRP